MVEVVALRRDQIGEMWAILKPMIEPALEYTLNEQSINDIKLKAEKGEYLLLLFKSDEKLLSVVSIEILEYPTKKILSVVTGGGSDMYEWRDEWWQQMEKIGREIGASDVVICGRAGWERVLSPYGFKNKYTILARTL